MVYGLIALLILIVTGSGGYLVLRLRGLDGMPWVVSTPTPTNTATPTTTPTIAPTATSAITPTAAPTVTPMTTVVTGTQGVALRVRAQPAGEIIGYLSEGTEVTLLKGEVLKDDIYWQMVETETLTDTGWVASEYLEMR